MCLTSQHTMRDLKFHENQNFKTLRLKSVFLLMQTVDMMWMKLTAGENETHYCQKKGTLERNAVWALHCFNAFLASGLSPSPPHQRQFSNTREAVKLDFRKRKNVGIWCHRPDSTPLFDKKMFRKFGNLITYLAGAKPQLFLKITFDNFPDISIKIASIINLTSKQTSSSPSNNTRINSNGNINISTNINIMVYGCFAYI